jgi:2-keto-4-pentenoate hydratase/2-oxohepta-3-ene-1,7-dioic acid hydratase in catechol pathway
LLAARSRTATPDYQARLVAGICTGGEHIAAVDTPAAIFGCCVGNDMTARMWWQVLGRCVRN